MESVAKRKSRYLRSGFEAEDANFQHANLCNADLYSAHFRSASLRAAQLENTRVEGSDFQNADFRDIPWIIFMSLAVQTKTNVAGMQWDLPPEEEKR
jgi:uncharacterized protein YjbI with pentapeptide repeats